MDGHPYKADQSRKAEDLKGDYGTTWGKLNYRVEATFVHAIGQKESRGFSFANMTAYNSHRYPSGAFFVASSPRLVLHVALQSLSNAYL